MPSLHIKNIHEVISFEQLQPLRSFSAKKDAKEWCKANNVKPARIVKLQTRFQYSYALDMGHNCFLVDDDIAAAIEKNKAGIYEYY